MSTSATSVDKKDGPPETLTLDELQIEALESMFHDLEEYGMRQQQFQQAAQQLQASINQNHSDWMGSAKAIQTFIKTISKHSGYVGDYLYDREKKCLTLKH